MPGSLPPSLVAMPFTRRAYSVATVTNKSLIDGFVDGRSALVMELAPLHHLTIDPMSHVVKLTRTTTTTTRAFTQ